MDTKKQNIHYCTILSSEQLIFLLEGKSSVNRYKCLYRLMFEAVRTKTVYSIKGIKIALEVGQVAASDVELAEYLGCNRKTIGKLIDSFNRLGMLTTRTNNRTSIHTLHFLTGWYVGGVLLTNPHYVRPSAITKGQTGDVRTPVFGNSPSDGEQSSVTDGCQSKEQKTDSIATGAALLSSSLLSSEKLQQPADGQELPPFNKRAADKAENPHIIDSGDYPSDEVGAENHHKAQDGINDGEAYPT